MALPIEPTPVLRGRDVKRFEERLEKDLKNPTPLKPTPKLENARELVKAYAVKGKKRI